MPALADAALDERELLDRFVSYPAESFEVSEARELVATAERLTA
jgi:hypothetical protein